MHTYIHTYVNAHTHTHRWQDRRIVVTEEYLLFGRLEEDQIIDQVKSSSQIPLIVSHLYDV
jgi:hypothetical protein